MARILAIQHVEFEGPGSISDWAAQAQHELSIVRPFKGERLPNPDSAELFISLGGPMNVDEEDRYPWLTEEKAFLREAAKASKKVLGICLGAQLIARAFGAGVYPNRFKEIGWFPIELSNNRARSRLFSGFPAQMDVFHWHGDTYDLPSDALLIATSSACRNQAFQISENVVGLQFHLETTATSLNALMENCGDELVPGPFIQKREQIVANDQKFADLNVWMSRLLEALLK